MMLQEQNEDPKKTNIADFVFQRLPERYLLPLEYKNGFAPRFIYAPSLFCQKATKIAFARLDLQSSCFVGAFVTQHKQP